MVICMAYFYGNTVSVVFKSIEKVLNAIADEHFKKSGAAQKWKKLSDRTIKDKMRLAGISTAKGKGRKLKRRSNTVKREWVYKPLLRYGNMWKRVYARVDREGFSGGTIHFGSKVKYAKFHIYGTKKMPRRDFTVFNQRLFSKYFEEYKGLIAQTAVEDTLRALKSGGLVQ